VKRARRIRLIVLDVDGVLTDGRLYYGPRGESLKVFDVKDGFALRTAEEAGLRVALISSRTSGAVSRRMKDLGIKEIHQGADDKLWVFRSLCRRLRVTPTEVAYMGDDLPDLPVLRQVGLRLAPADGAVEVRAIAHWVSHFGGGRGAVREAVEAILRSQGKWGPA
jgi:3-deoxy-D-manno-octulosonate 8-phosphate phosphatase (KDO 8-P phosphatase)